MLPRLPVRDVQGLHGKAKNTEERGELMKVATLHQPLAYRPSADIPDLDDKLADSDQGIEDWFRHWDTYYGEIYLSIR
jgi:hypothetical protein